VETGSLHLHSHNRFSNLHETAVRRLLGPRLKSSRAATVLKIVQPQGWCEFDSHLRHQIESSSGNMPHVSALSDPRMLTALLTLYRLLRLSRRAPTPATCSTGRALANLSTSATNRSYGHSLRDVITAMAVATMALSRSLALSPHPSGQYPPPGSTHHAANGSLAYIDRRGRTTCSSTRSSSQRRTRVLSKRLTKRRATVGSR